MSKWKHNKKKSNNVEIDFEYIVDQVDVGPKVVTVSGLLDLGEQEGGYIVDTDGFTYFKSEDEVNDFLDFIAENPTLGERAIEEHGLDEYEEVDEVYKLPFKIVKNKFVFMEQEDEGNVSYAPTKKKAEKLVDKALELLEAQRKRQKGYVKKLITSNIELIEDTDLEPMTDVFEVPCILRKMDDEYEVAVWATNTDNEVQYVEDDEDSVRQYRIPLNPPFKGAVRGFRLSQDRKTELFNSKSLVDLLKTCDLERVIEEGNDDEGDLSLLAGAIFQTEITKKDTFVRSKGRMSAPEDTEVPELEHEPMVVSFEDDVEDIVAAMRAFFVPRAYIEKIKLAKNFEGSNMEKAIAILEDGVEAPESDSESGEDDPVGQDTSEEKSDEKASEEVSEVSKSKTKRKSRKAKEEEVEDEDEGEDPEPEEDEKPKRKRKGKSESSSKSKKSKPDPEPEVEEEADGGGFDDDLPFAPVGLMYDNNFLHCI